MTLTELFSVIGSVSGTIAALIAFFGKQAVSALQEEHRSGIRQVEEVQKSELQRQLESFKRELGFINKIDEKLFELRMESYTRLWQITSVLPMWPRNVEIRYTDLLNLSQNLCKWYYGAECNSAPYDEKHFGEVGYTNRDVRQGGSALPGGMLLTEDAKKAYIALQEQINDVISIKRLNGDNDKVSTNDYNAIREMSSALRTEMTKDLLSRKEAPVS